jgi:ADP-ribosylglycohydrolase
VPRSTPEDRARASLYGLAIGDALGMPTQELPRSRAVEVMAHDGFVDAPLDQPISPGLPAGTVTDDTEQMLVLAGLLVDGDGAVDPGLLAQRLLAWEAEVAARGSLDLLGPSTRRALAAIADGADPATSGVHGTTNGAAMRVAPVGVATPCDDLAHLVDVVVAVDRPTHRRECRRRGSRVRRSAVARGRSRLRGPAARPLDGGSQRRRAHRVGGPARRRRTS